MKNSQRKIILEVAVSLDGLIEGYQGEYDWCFTDQDYGMRGFLDSIVTLYLARNFFFIFISCPADCDPKSS